MTESNDWTTTGGDVRPEEQGRIWTLHFRGEESGPYTLQELGSMLADGTITTAAMVWRDGMTAWAPIRPAQRQAVEPPPLEQITTRPPTVSYTSPAKPLRRERRGYRYRVGHRSFIFQLWLLAWTVTYGVWLASVISSAGSHAPQSTGSANAPTFNAPSSPFNVADILAGVTSGWICLAAGWGTVGLPIGIAAVATLENNK